jgi:hypothetical protein
VTARDFQSLAGSLLKSTTSNAKVCQVRTYVGRHIHEAFAATTAICVEENDRN